MSYDEHLISMAGGDGEPDTLDLDAIQARVNAATEGPWDFEPIDGQFGVYSLEMQDNGDYPAVIGYPSDGGAEADADFSAHARTDVPALLSLVRAQALKLDSVRMLADDMSTFPDLVPAKAMAGLVKSALEARK